MAKYYDTILGEYVKNPGVRGLSLDNLASKYFDYETINYKDLTNKGKINFEDIDLEKASIYSGEDVYITWELYKKQKEEEKGQKGRNPPSPLYQGGMEKENSLSSLSQGGVVKQAPLIKGETRGTSRGILKTEQNEQNLNSHFSILYDVEIPLLEVLKDMELVGVKIDRDKLKGIGILLENEISNLEKEIYSLAGEEFNIKSPKQVGEILFEKLGLKATKKTKTGYSVNSEVLEGLAKENKIAKKIIDYRTYSKLLSTYIEGLLEELDENDIIHTSFNQTITSTGRLSSTNPNLQNIPSGDGIAGEIRNAFIPFSEDEIIMAFDYSQVEVRVLAIMSGDENLLNAFENNLDIHQNTAKFIFGKDDISKSERKIAKAVNFGVIYGISAFGLSKMIDGGISESKKYIDKFYENYPKVKTFFDDVVENCKEKGYVETLFGRKRMIPGINDRNRIIAEAAKREAINMPIQGTATGDIIKLAMINIFNYIKENNLKSKLIMQVHDEIVFSVKKDEKEILEKEIKSIMENILENYKSKIQNNNFKKFPKLLVDLGKGKNRGEAK